MILLSSQYNEVGRAVRSLKRRFDELRQEAS
ncbi:hypothetical protein SAMN04489732_109268 [Amycolatopsis saalfeldensis]|uniref:Uncharacterized protein n=1 Tax=Amycolatopsis saalfeldensis TaxID=394193 RepID=A0A1H8XXW7_9PSEU|nr:hypothetical protein SAMN04489732_109268 [Amycolatopsis saalfeldensis]